MGIGGGGPSQLGRRTGKSEDESVDILCRAFDGGVNFVDTAEGHGTEEIIARALQGRARESVIISTKKSKIIMCYATMSGMVWYEALRCFNYINFVITNS